MMIEWEDVTSYSRDERGRIAPQSWEARFGDIRLCVTRHRDYRGWVMQCYGICRSFRMHSLGIEDVEDAKAEAVTLLKEWLTRHHLLIYTGEEE
jgi:hypothetical protein